MHSPTPGDALTRLSAYDYDLPTDLIAQRPISERDASRLLVVDRAAGTLEHGRAVRDLPDLLLRGDLLVLNNSRVIPARLRGRKTTGGAAEALLIRQVGAVDWLAMTRPGLHCGQIAIFGDELRATVARVREDGLRRLRFEGSVSAVDAAIHRLGELPTPPYVREPLAEPERYQTTYAKAEGSIAAPTAGLHFTPELLHELETRGVGHAFVTLHVGPGTFQPVKVEDVRTHQLHEEWAHLPAATATAIRRTKDRRGRVVAVGTTSVRTLETAARTPGPLGAWSGDTGLFIYPGFEFRVVDAIMTNFHLPRSTLLMLVAAFAGHRLTMSAYAAAVRERYRFYSFGDAMLIR